MTDSLTTGSKRLEQVIELAVLQSQDAQRAATLFVVDAISSDPGVKALVEFAGTLTDIKELEIATLNGYAKEVLRKWEHGDP